MRIVQPKSEVAKVDAVPTLDTFTIWLVEYGSISLFFLLALGIVALPIPEETLMVIAGAFMSKGTLSIPSTIVSAYLGSICGISLSYVLGRTVGLFFIHKYGSWIGLTEERLRGAHRWFERYGKWSLTFGYFVPGVRHFTGLCAGATYLKARHFALFAYTGAFLWVTIFLSLGYFFGNYWPQLFHFVEVSIDWIILVVLIMLIAALIAAWVMKVRHK